MMLDISSIRSNDEDTVLTEGLVFITGDEDEIFIVLSDFNHEDNLLLLILNHYYHKLHCIFVFVLLVVVPLRKSHPPLVVDDGTAIDQTNRLMLLEEFLSLQLLLEVFPLPLSHP